MDPKLFCDQISKTFRDLSATLNLTNNDFIRTTEQRHHKSVENIWNILEKNEIYLSKYSGWYSVSDEAIMRMKLKLLMVLKNQNPQVLQSNG